MLYKYLSLDEYTIENIKNNFLYFNIASNFNDPFDMHPVTEMTNVEYEEIKKTFLQSHPQYNNDISIITPSYLQDMMDISVIMGMLNSHYAVTCFSRTPVSVLMWSHYAGKHRGICIGFNVDEFDDGKNAVGKFIKVSNSQNYGDFNAYIVEIKYDNLRPRLKKAKFVDVKAKEWAYEDEVRIVFRSPIGFKLPGTVEYDPSFLKEIIFGALCKYCDFIDIIQKVEESHIEVDYVLATLDEENYKINLTNLSWEQIAQFQRIYDDLMHMSKDDVVAFCRHAGVIKHGTKESKRKWHNLIGTMSVAVVYKYFFKYKDLSLKNIIGKRRSGVEISVEEDCYYALLLLYVKNMYNRV